MNKTETRKMKKEFGLEDFCPFLDGSCGDLLSDYLYEKTEEMRETVGSFIYDDMAKAAELSIMLPHIIEDNIPESHQKKMERELYRLWSEASSLWCQISALEDDDAFPSMYRRVHDEKIFHIYQKSEVVFWDALLYLSSGDDELFRSTMSELNMRISNLARYSCQPLGELVVLKLNVLMEREGESEEWRRTLSVNSCCKAVVEYKYEYYSGKGDSGNAGLALRSLRDSCPPPRGFEVPEIEKRILEFFEEAGMVEDVKRQLQHIFLCYEQEDLSYYLRYRELSSDDEFDFVRSRLDGVQTYGFMDQILAYEGKYEELFHYMERHASLKSMRRNASCLASFDLERFCSLCEKYIDSAASNARGKNEYHVIAELLDIMKSVDHDRAQRKAEDIIRGNSRKRNLKQMILDRGFSAPFSR